MRKNSKSNRKLSTDERQAFASLARGESDLSDLLRLLDAIGIEAKVLTSEEKEAKYQDSITPAQRMRLDAQSR